MTTSELKKIQAEITQGEWTVELVRRDDNDENRWLPAKAGRATHAWIVPPVGSCEIIAVLEQDDGVLQKGDIANAEAIALVPKLLRENERLKLQNEKFESLLYQISRSVCLDQKLSGKCLCFSCEAKAALAGEGGK